MIGGTLSVGLADLAANVLAVVLVAVLLGLQSGAPADEATRPRLLPHRPLDPAGMVAHLAGSRRIGGDLAIDLSDGIILRRPGEAPRRLAGDADLARALESVGGDGRPVRLNVFDARHYAAVRAALAGAGLASTELSIPAALRRPDRRDWSDGFHALVAAPSSLAGFRRGLDDLLAGRGPGSAAAGPSGLGLTLAAIRDTLVALAVIGLVAAALRIERRHHVVTTRGELR